MRERPWDYAWHGSQMGCATAIFGSIVLLGGVISAADAGSVGGALESGVVCIAGLLLLGLAFVSQLTGAICWRLDQIRMLLENQSEPLSTSPPRQDSKSPLPLKPLAAPPATPPAKKWRRMVDTNRKTHK